MNEIGVRMMSCDDLFRFIVLYVRHRTLYVSDTHGPLRLSESCRKNADVPRSPFAAKASLVPSAGTIALQIELVRPGASAPVFARY